jgi:hypothetical protein
MPSGRRWLLFVVAFLGSVTLHAENTVTPLPRSAGESPNPLLLIEPGAARPEDLSTDPHVREMIQQLWAQSHFGSLCYERAAWIVREEDGSYSCVQVPPTYECNALRFVPEKPLGTVALMHTHPTTNGVGRRDWGEDERAAELIGVPLYTIERNGLRKYDPVSNKNSREQVGLKWMDRRGEDGCECKVMTPQEIRMANIRLRIQRHLATADVSTASAGE